MNTRNVTIHHLAFFRADTDSEYGQRTVTVTQAPQFNDATHFAEQAFHDTNAPGAVPVEVSRNGGRCYSLSCGDVVEVPSAEEGQPPTLWLCEAMGFAILTRAEFDMLLKEQRHAHTANPDKHWSMDFDGVRLLGTRRRMEGAMMPS